jgi:hypothetical protein
MKLKIYESIEHYHPRCTTAGLPDQQSIVVVSEGEWACVQSYDDAALIDIFTLPPNRVRIDIQNLSDKLDASFEFKDTFTSIRGATRGGKQ